VAAPDARYVEEGKRTIKEDWRCVYWSRREGSRGRVALVFAAWRQQTRGDDTPGQRVDKCHG